MGTFNKPIYKYSVYPMYPQFSLKPPHYFFLYRFFPFFYTFLPTIFRVVIESIRLKKMSISTHTMTRLHPSFESRPDPYFSGRFPKPDIPTPAKYFSGKFSNQSSGATYAAYGTTPKAYGTTSKAYGTTSRAYGMSSLMLRFPPNFVRQLSTKARRNCSNIGVAQIVAASWSDKVKAVDAVAVEVVVMEEERRGVCGDGNVELGGDKFGDFIRHDGTVAIHAGERVGRAIESDAITTPVFNTSAYFFKKTSDLIDFKEKRSTSFEYGRYGNYTTQAAEEKISALEGAESTVLMASGMCASTVLLMALVPAGGHIVTTTDCYRRTRMFIETMLPKMGISASVIDPADVEALKLALDTKNVSLFFTESPTNPFLRCVDIELVSKLCRKKGALVVVDGTFATPLNQKALALGADIVVHSATKYIAGHNDVLGGCVSGPEKLVSVVRNLHHILGGTLNPNAAYLIIRGMKTMHLRVQQQNSTGIRMAELLEAHPKIKRVYYPGLKSHPEHQLAMKQMTGFGGVVSFEVRIPSFEIFAILLGQSCQNAASFLF
ncbi:hypothetical protein Leryth_020763 [Lithospermum erythrorhizon]|nr:hypothetical protein Leryth_020763 [Lithospermum erythrorhizon]